MRLLIIGGTGAFSGRVTEMAVERGHRVAVLNRGRRALPSEIKGRVKHFTASREAILEFADKLRSFRPNAVVDCICYEPSEAEALVQVFPDIERVVMISSVDVYGQDSSFVPIDENQPEQPESEYGKGKLESEQLLFAALGKRLTVFRPSHILGRGFLTTSIWGRSPHLLNRIRKGKPILTVDGGRNLMTPVYAGDVCEWIMRALENQDSGGQVFNAVGANIITKEYYYRIIGKIVGRDVEILTVPSPVFRDIFPQFPQFMSHRIYSCRKAIEILKYYPQVSVEEMLRETVSHMIENGLVGEHLEEPFDDRLTELLQRNNNDLKSLLLERSEAQ